MESVWDTPTSWATATTELKWVIEFEVVEKEHGVGEGETSIFYGKMGEGIGQSLLYASAYA